MKIKALLLGLVLMLGLSACTVVEPGHVGIVVNTMGKDRGVSEIPTTQGLVWYNPVSTSVLDYPTNVQTAVWTASTSEGNPVNEELTFTTKDNMKVSVDVSLAYSLQKDKVPAFYVKFRNADLYGFTHGFLRNGTRNAFDEVASSYTVDKIMGENAEFVAAVREKVQKEMGPFGVVIEQFGIIGAPRPPQQVTEAINAKVQAIQIAIQKQNEVAQAEADAKKQVAQAAGFANSAIETAKGEAEANRIKQQSITPTILEWRRLDIEQQKLEKWNGSLPSTVLGGNVTPMIQVR